MDQNNPEITLSPTLIEMLEQGKCVLVAGPLVSLAPGMHLSPPTPAWLAFELAERIGRQLDNYELPWVAQLYADKEGTTALRSWVSGRLFDLRYRPNLIHHLIVQLPFSYIIYTSQDHLLRQAYERLGKPATYILPGGNLGYATDSTIVYLYGSAEHPETLKLTGDERMCVLEDYANLADDLRGWARNHSLLFLGYAINDPELMDLYYQLRPQLLDSLPRAYLVGPGASSDYEKYWDQHNATIYSLDAPTFLYQLANDLNQNLQKKNKPVSPIDLSIEEAPEMSQEELHERDRLKARFEYLSGLNQWVETGAELRRRFEPHFVIQMRAELGGSVSPRDAGMAAQSYYAHEDATALGQLQSGNIEWSQGNLDLARVYFEEAMRRDPELIDAQLSLFHLFIEKGEVEEALRVYQQIVQVAPQQAILPERYQIRKILGQTNLGISYLVYDQPQEQYFTVTMLRRAFALQEEALASFARQ